jgi:hypothetical protein
MVIGYDVFRGSGRAAEFVRVNETPISGTRLAVLAPTQNDFYQVRAVKLEETPCGSYFNSSQGIFVSVSAPTFTVQPTGFTGMTGGTATFAAQVTGASGYQWEKDGVPIAGATAPTLTVSNLAAGDAGSYCLVACNAFGTTRSASVFLSVETPKRGRLINLSARAFAGAGDQTFIVGFTVAGRGNKRMLVRGVGPTLSAFAVDGALPNPRIDLYLGREWLFGNQSWTATGDREAIMAISGHKLGSLVISDEEAALVRELSAGGYTAHLKDEAGRSGVGLFDVIDASAAEPGTAEFDGQPRLINLSVRAFVGSGFNTVIAGFVLNGNTPRRLMLRGMGPILANFGLSGVLTNPKLRIYRGDQLIQDWTIGPLRPIATRSSRPEVIRLVRFLWPVLMRCCSELSPRGRTRCTSSA